MRKKEAVAWLRAELNQYQNPGPFHDSELYVRYEAKADAFEDVLDHLYPDWRSMK